METNSTPNSRWGYAKTTKVLGKQVFRTIRPTLIRQVSFPASLTWECGADFLDPNSQNKKRQITCIWCNGMFEIDEVCKAPHAWMNPEINGNLNLMFERWKGGMLDLKNSGRRDVYGSERERLDEAYMDCKTVMGRGNVIMPQYQPSRGNATRGRCMSRASRGRSYRTR